MGFRDPDARDFRHGLGDIRVGAAAAKIAAHPLAHFEHRHIGGAVDVALNMAGNACLDLVQHRHGRADLSRRAIAALEAVMLDERRLHRVQFLRRTKPFDRRHRIALVHDGKAKAGIDADAVHQHRAGAALTMIAAFLGAHQADMIAQRI